MKIADKTLRYVKALTAQSISKAGCGHTGSSLGASAMMLALFKNHYNFDISDTDYLNRDRLVLSAGHTAPLYYTLLSLFGYDVSLQDLKNLGGIGSKTPKYPEYKTTDGVEVTTGISGQGVANAVGLALAESIMAERFNSVGFSIINHYCYCLASDGDLMEGTVLEACSLAGNLNLDKLIILYDSNDVTMDGSLNLTNRENVAKKFKAMGFNVIKCNNGNDFNACSRAISKAKASRRPSIIIFKTTSGIGTAKEGTSSAHMAVLNEEELKLYNQRLGVNESFYVPNDVRDYCMASSRMGKLNHEKWNQDLAVYANSNPELYRQFITFFDKKKIDVEKLARNSYKWENISGKDLNKIILNELSAKLLQIVGGTADCSLVTGAVIEDAGSYNTGNRRGRNIHFGLRESAMAGIINGISLYEDFLPFCCTSLCYATLMLPAIKMSALMSCNCMYFFTNDSIKNADGSKACDADEQLAQLRLIKGLKVFRPCDANELIAGFKYFLKEGGPVAFILSSQPMEIVDGKFKESEYGAYLLKPAKKEADIAIYASGSEVALALSVASELGKKYDVSVVSVPCTQLFDQQSTAYKNKVLQKNATLRVAIEASSDNIWYKYVGDNGLVCTLEDYENGIDGKEVYLKAGFNSKDIVKKISRRMQK